MRCRFLDGLMKNVDFAAIDGDETLDDVDEVRGEDRNRGERLKVARFNRDAQLRVRWHADKSRPSRTLLFRRLKNPALAERLTPSATLRCLWWRKSRFRQLGRGTAEGKLESRRALSNGARECERLARPEWWFFGFGDALCPPRRKLGRRVVFEEAESARCRAADTAEPERVGQAGRRERSQEEHSLFLTSFRSSDMRCSFWSQAAASLSVFKPSLCCLSFSV